MGYPLELQALVVEDEKSSKEYYDAVFDSLVVAGMPLSKPRYAFCHQDGAEALDGDVIYHLVILDLRLPRCPDEPATDGVDLGLDLLTRCRNRNSFPIPALLIVSGHLDQANQGDLHALVRSGFAHGQVLIKGPNLEQDIKAALSRCIQYCQVGLHIRDGGLSSFPTLSPRDEDLLRRAVLTDGYCKGLDLRWWSAEYAPPFSGDAAFSGWTKTLMGAFLLDGGRGRSRPTFFKLAPNAGAQSVAAEAQLLQHKLSHIKVSTPTATGDRSLLITQKVGDDDGPPVSLVDFLGRPISEVKPRLSEVVREVAQQVRRLGDNSPDQLPIRRLLWPNHDPERIAAQWERWRGPDLASRLGLTYDPVAMFAKLRGSEVLLRVGVQSALHGDLNPTNVALDVRSDSVHGYIFDSSGVRAGINFRDLAMLEVTSLLHLPFGTSENLVQACANLYQVRYLQRALPPAGMLDRAANTWMLVSELRQNASECPNASVLAYAIMVFDHALIQLGGLSFAVSRNKIRYPDQAAEFAARAANWVELVGSRVLSEGTSDGNTRSPIVRNDG